MKYFECPAVGLAFINKSHSRSFARIDRIRMYLLAGRAGCCVAVVTQCEVESAVFSVWLWGKMGLKMRRDFLI